MGDGPSQQPPDQAPPRGMSHWKKGCLGCGGAILGIFILLVIIGSIVGPPKKTNSTSSKPASPSPASSLSRAVAYLYEVDHHQHSQAAHAELLTSLSQHCAEDPFLLSAAASNTALDTTLPGGKVQDVYGVLVQLKKDVGNSPRSACEKKLAAVPAELAPPTRTPSPSASVAPKPAEEHDPAASRSASPASAAARPSESPSAHDDTPQTAGPKSSAVILSPSGRYYRAGQYCPAADAGMSTQDAHGTTITCDMDSGRYRWHY
ncbi:hypothetical protein [Streptomyces triculaminicus]|uniref:hypothetical protein n=1 Tax=Streptomyces triculaminicus TaxID=2816232 RepID=UPI0037D2D84F